jgi:NADH-quinone oxidoreductase subunit L
MGRLIYLTFYGQPRMSHEVEHHVHESPKSMTVPLVILAICSVGAGYLGVPHSLWGANRFEKFLAPVFAKEAPLMQTEEPAQLAAGKKEEEHTDPMEYGLMGLSVLAAVVGLGMAHRSYAKAGKDYVEPIAVKAPPLYTLLYNKWFVDEGYDYVFTGRRKDWRYSSGRNGSGRSRVVVRCQNHRWSGQRCRLGNPRRSHAFDMVG